MLVKATKTKALIVNASSSKFGNNLELLLSSEVTGQIGSSVKIFGVCLIITNKRANFITLNVRNKDLLSSNLSNVTSFDNLIVELSLASRLTNRFDCLSFEAESYCITITELIKSKFECLITFECPHLALVNLKVDDVITVDGTPKAIAFVGEASFDIIFHQSGSNNKDLKF